MWSQTSAHAAEKDKVASGKKKASLAQLLEYRCGMAGIDKKVDGKEPGLLLVISKLTRPDEVSPQAFTKWYENVHIPDILKTSGMKEASRWESTNPADERPYLALYPLGDLGLLQTDEFKAIPVHSDLLPGSRAIFDYADFDTRYYRLVQLYEPEKAKSDQPDFVIMAAFTPKDEQDYERWYREEHLQDCAKVPGWQRTARYALTFARNNRRPAEENQLPSPPKFLTLLLAKHYFDGECLPTEGLQKAGESKWTKEIMSTMTQSQMAVFRKLSQYRRE